ncbi:XRE family transcriptional regulator|uniref:XRE family transcriptional regulator n=1 Tax=Brenneria salicis ATCC 15712 = DSM 30166 TaxID=714314 RepID=A0A366HWU4_9GAMM|nr:cupin domain-containing protein [Brenneria salicis]NMN93273.1 XRE family transcriptional regulator [Brenneria salicis ATCC 15712 = DSM 30166]RBP57918.1 XRE family transcriptional regulator [Brenneria salicis ATCC 15712 = DSM 30166]RLM28919.1 XRE family transcriptional regulator [Brenneria salicis ATCC 15712 = DSM 30166]
MKKNGDTSGTVLSNLGMRLRHARLAQELTLKQLAQKVECSESLLSKLENEVATPSLAMLHRLAHALETSISDLMAENWVTESPVLKPDQRRRKRFLQRNKQGGIDLENLTYHHKGGLLQGNIHIIEPGVASDGLIEHQGEEMGYVLTGEIALYLGEETHHLRAGDSFYFPSHIPHGYRNTGKTVAHVLWVNTPVTF